MYLLLTLSFLAHTDRHLYKTQPLFLTLYNQRARAELLVQEASPIKLVKRERLDSHLKLYKYPIKRAASYNSLEPRTVICSLKFGGLNNTYIVKVSVSFGRARKCKHKFIASNFCRQTEILKDKKYYNIMRQ